MIPRGKIAIAILTLLVLVIIAVTIAVLYPIENAGNAPTLNEEQKMKVAGIALNDTLAKDKLREEQFKYFSQQGQGWVIDPEYPRVFTIGNITICKVHEIAPGIDRTRYLPSVELLMGNKSLGDINVYIYVDLEKERVAYIGYTGRSGPHATGYYYTAGEDGIVEHTEDTNRTKNYDNVTIVDTGYSEGQVLTDKEKSGLFDIAKTNSTAMDFLNKAASKGQSYDLTFSVSPHESEINGHHYIATYPDMTIRINGGDPGIMSRFLIMTIDGKSNKVILVKEITWSMPPIDYIPPMNR